MMSRLPESKELLSQASLFNTAILDVVSEEKFSSELETSDSYPLIQEVCRDFYDVLIKHYKIIDSMDERQVINLSIQFNTLGWMYLANNSGLINILNRMQKVIFHDSLQLRNDNHDMLDRIRNSLTPHPDYHGLDERTTAQDIFSKAIDILKFKTRTDEILRLKSSLHYGVSESTYHLNQLQENLQQAIDALVAIDQKQINDERNLLALTLKLVRVLPANRMGQLQYFVTASQQNSYDNQLKFIPIALDILDARNLDSDIADRIVLQLQLINILDYKSQYTFALEYLNNLINHIKTQINPSTLYELLEQKLCLQIRIFNTYFSKHLAQQNLHPELPIPTFDFADAYQKIQDTAFELLGRTPDYLQTENVSADKPMQKQADAFLDQENKITLCFNNIFNRLLNTCKDFRNLTKHEASEFLNATDLYRIAKNVFEWQNLEKEDQSSLDDLENITTRILSTGLPEKLIKKYSNFNLDNSLIPIWKTILEAIHCYTKIMSQLFQSYRNTISWCLNLNPTNTFHPQSSSRIFSKVLIFTPVNSSEANQAPEEFLLAYPNVEWRGHDLDMKCFGKFSTLIENNINALETGLTARQNINKQYPAVKFFYSSNNSTISHSEQKTIVNKRKFESTDKENSKVARF